MLSQVRNGLLIVVALLLSSGATALTLSVQEITQQGSVTDGNLTYSDFEIVFSGALSSLDASDVQITFLGDGVRINGPFSAADGEIGDVFLAFNVSVVSGPEITGVSLLSNGVAAGTGAQASVDEFILSANGGFLGALSAFDTGGTPGIDQASDSATFGGWSHIRVEKDIIVDSTLLEAGAERGGSLGGSARISSIEQRFTTVPEVGSLGMLLGGTLGLAVFSRRRR